ncbi:Uncharacterised protein [Mycobacteroides abscessus subsp. abscessus]|nr:Uncharacterised protein [Mycobacteroides abscessus subsp. abscessus]
MIALSSLTRIDAPFLRSAASATGTLKVDHARPVLSVPKDCAASDPTGTKDTPSWPGVALRIDFCATAQLSASRLAGGTGGRNHVAIGSGSGGSRNGAGAACALPAPRTTAVTATTTTTQSRLYKVTSVPLVT